MYWQTLVVYGIVALAFLAIARRTWRAVQPLSQAKSQAGGPCGGGGCASCPLSRVGNEKQVVTLESLKVDSKLVK